MRAVPFDVTVMAPLLALFSNVPPRFQKARLPPVAVIVMDAFGFEDVFWIVALGVT